MADQVAALVYTQLGTMTAEQLDQATDAVIEFTAQQVADQIEFDGWDVIVEPAQEAMAEAAEDAVVSTVTEMTTGDGAIAQLGVDERSALVNQVYQDALEYAEQRAAELIGMRRDAEGNLVPNPDASMTITQTTRDKVKQIVVDALGPAPEGEEAPTIEERLLALKDDVTGSPLFSETRATFIARAELAMAHGQGALESFRAMAAKTGFQMEKAWTTSEDGKVEETCLLNAAAGWIPLEEPFPSGDMTYPAHPRCRCAVKARVKPGT